jgi:hypothetical protein
MLNPCDERKHEVLGVSQKELQKAFWRKKDFSYQELWIFVSGNHGFFYQELGILLLSGIMSNRNLELWYIFRLLSIPIIVSSDIQGICFSLVSMMEKRGLFLEQCR